MDINHIKEIYIQKGKIYFASIELTQNCNFKCKHCYCSDKANPNMTLDAYKKIIDKLYDTGCLFLNFTGGEIFTNKNFIDIYTYAKNKGFIIDLLTNISLLNESMISVFKKYPPNSIAVTLYGSNPQEYELFTGDAKNYNRVMKALNLLRQNGLHFVLRSVAAKTYYHSLYCGNFQEIAEKMGASFKYDPIIFPKTSGDKSPLSECLSPLEIVQLENASDIRRKAWIDEIQKTEPFVWTCRAGLNSFSIDYKGDAYVCGLFRKDPISILDNDISTVLDHLRRIHACHIEIVKNNECSKCQNRRICKWCPAYSLIYNGDENKKIPFLCELANERVRSFGRK